MRTLYAVMLPFVLLPLFPGPGSGQALPPGLTVGPAVLLAPPATGVQEIIVSPGARVRVKAMHPAAGCLKQQTHVGTLLAMEKDTCRMETPEVGGVGALLGFAIGSGTQVDRWEAVPLDRLQVTASPHRGG